MDEKIDQKLDKPEDANLVHNFSESTKNMIFSPKILAIFGLIVVVGIVSGYLLSQSQSGSGFIKTGIITSSGVSKGAVEGSNDTKTFKDTTEGTLKEGGIEGEGAFHLERPGGISQNVYLTSSIVDLSKYLNKKIKVWGQTQKAQHAGWLMDVGKVEVL